MNHMQWVELKQCWHKHKGAMSGLTNIRIKRDKTLDKLHIWHDGGGGGRGELVRLLPAPWVSKELEKITEEQRERKKNRGERERETTQINVVITCHAHNRNSWPRSGKDKKESSVLRVAAKHPGDTLLRQFMMVLEFFPSFPIHRDNVVL